MLNNLLEHGFVTVSTKARFMRYVPPFEHQPHLAPDARSGCIYVEIKDPTRPDRIIRANATSYSVGAASTLKDLARPRRWRNATVSVRALRPQAGYKSGTLQIQSLNICGHWLVLN
ncbi:hypothetical protein IPM09_02060 [Candidatus Saccharibacteria bacterium]|nr:MAG: hypothetical protein IPM09_02060 [Candidatus Saccharibacteria bacterium]